MYDKQMDNFKFIIYRVINILYKVFLLFSFSLYFIPLKKSLIKYNDTRAEEKQLMDFGSCKYHWVFLQIFVCCVSRLFYFFFHSFLWKGSQLNKIQYCTRHASLFLAFTLVENKKRNLKKQTFISAVFSQNTSGGVFSL